MIKLVWVVMVYSALYPKEIEPRLIEEPYFNSFEECEYYLNEALKDVLSRFVTTRCELREIKINIQEINIEDIILNRNS